MQSSNTKLCLTMIVGFLAIETLGTSAQSVDPAGDSKASVAGIAIVAGRPFSATKYSRLVKVLPDGKQLFIANQRYPIHLARDAEGRLRLQQVDLFAECDQPRMQEPPHVRCGVEIVFDPKSRTITHWPEGDRAGRVAVVVPLTQTQTDQVEESTSQTPNDRSEFEPDASSVTTRKLGEKVIEGVRVLGVRRTTIFPVGHDGNKVPITRIHEVWTSPDLNLLIKTIDGDPNGEETVTGLEKISLQPDSALFQSPTGYQVQRRSSGNFVDSDRQFLAKWSSR